MKLMRQRDYTWTPPRDFREICACQRHARRERALWNRALRGVRRRGVALLVGVPLAFGAVGIPIEAMNVSLPRLARRAAHEISGSGPFPIFTTRAARATFLQPRTAPSTLTVTAAKEEFFRTEVPYGSIIYAEAMKNRLAPELVAAVVEAESDFRPRLVSNKQAQGLMQIVPETSRLMGCDDPFDPRANVAAGAKYLRYLMNRFGDERIALAAYNAGEGKVERLGGIPPYPETLEYLQRVTTHTHRYQQRVQNRFIAAMQMQRPVSIQ
jgi:soluble lytic murein transglycosylase-like protein